MRRPTKRSRRRTAASVTICNSPWVRPKKKAANAIQYVMLTAADALGRAGSNAWGSNSTANMDTTSAGDPSMIASVRRLCLSTSRLRRVSTLAWPHQPTAGAREVTCGGSCVRGVVRCSFRLPGVHAGWVPEADALVDPRGSSTPKWRRASAGDPSNTSRPSVSSASRSQSRRSSVLWVVSRTVVPSSASRRSVRISARAVRGSRPEVGSSRKIARGRVSSSTPMLARLRCPPLSEPTIVPARPSSSRLASTAVTCSSTISGGVPRGRRRRAA